VCQLLLSSSFWRGRSDYAARRKNAEGNGSDLYENIGEDTLKTPLTR
jgi:hypothetical protein